jgi:hypothetical protein
LASQKFTGVRRRIWLWFAPQYVANREFAGWYPDPYDADSEIYLDENIRWRGHRFRPTVPAVPAATRWQRYRQLLAKHRGKIGTVFLSLAVALLGAWGGSYFTAQATADQARQSFTLALRSDAYAGFDNAVDLFHAAAEFDFRLYFSPLPQPSTPLKEDVRGRLDALQVAYSKLGFYGTEDAIKSAHNALSAAQAVNSGLADFTSKHPNLSDLTPAEHREFGPIYSKVCPLLGPVEKAQEAFREVARHDLHLPPAPASRPIDISMCSAVTSAEAFGTPTFTTGGH